MSKIDTSLATPDIIQQSVEENDLNEACLIIQDAIGQSYGDTASVYFSGYEDAEDYWSKATKEERQKIMRGYIDLEQQYLDLFGKP